MKKIVSVALIVALVSAMMLLLPGCQSANDDLTDVRAKYDRHLEGTTLNVYNWGEYISDGMEDALDVNAAFEKLTGIKVNYVTYDSNEVMYGKLQSKSVSYDLVIPSDYMIERMIKENMLQKLDFSQISNYDLIDAKYKDLYFDPENAYSVPYNVGMVALIYNSAIVEETPDSWSVMWDEKYKGQVLQFDNSRDGFMVAQMLLGLDVNSEDKADWDKAADKLRDLHGNLKGYVMDDVFAEMEGGNAAIAPYYAGDFLTMKEENDDLEMVYPKEGTNIFVDSICIPADAKNVEAAHMYINFLLEPEVALANAEYLCYASPNTSVIENEDYSLKNAPELYNVEGVKAYYYHDLPDDVRSYYEKLWLSVKADDQ